MKKAIQFVCILLVVAMLAVPVSAAGFTPSVEQKGAPVVKETGVKVTAMADLSTASAEVKAAVEEAAKVISDAKDLGEAVPALADALTAMGSNVKASKLVVRDLFYVELSTPLAEGEEKALTFEMKGISANDLLMVMVFVDGEWVVIDSDKVEVSAKGEVKVTFDVLGPVAFVTEQK